jgi:GTP-binding protein
VDGDEFVLADLPGLIEGAHAGSGLGDRFLGHVERCAALLHLVDATGDDVVAAYRTVRLELERYGHGLAAKPELVALSKCDALAEADIAARLAALATVCTTPVVPLSALTGSGVLAAVRALYAHVREARTAHCEAQAAAGGWRP